MNIISKKLYEALLAVYKDIELQNVKGGSDELNMMVQGALKMGEKLSGNKEV